MLASEVVFDILTLAVTKQGPMAGYYTVPICANFDTKQLRFTNIMIWPRENANRKTCAL